MTLFSLFSRRQGSAPRARERLQILLSHERSICSKSDLISIIREEILTALGKHIIVGQDNVTIRMDRGATLSTLDIEVLIPHSSGMPVSSFDRDFVKTLRIAH
jgi:cell division topological specificity factor